MLSTICRRAGITLLCLMAISLWASTAQARQVKMCTLNWEPFYGDKLPRQGFFTEIARTAFDRAGHSAKAEFMPWARAKLEVEQGDRDVLLGAYYNEERAKTYRASDPIYTAEVGLVGLEDLGVDSFDSLRQLSDYTIGYGRGFTVSEEFDNAAYLDKEPAENLNLNVKKLFAGRVDLIAGSFENIRYIAQQQNRNVDKLVFLEPPLKKSTLHIMVSRGIDDSEELLADFHNGLRQIREDGTYNQILREMGYK
jgi:polar amino acid transport system substrate-binding protein